MFGSGYHGEHVRPSPFSADAKDMIVPGLGAISILPVDDSRGAIHVHIIVRKFGTRLPPAKMAYALAIKDDLSLMWLPAPRADENNAFTGDEHIRMRSTLDAFEFDDLPFYPDVLRKAAGRYVQYHTDIQATRVSRVEGLLDIEEAGGLIGQEAAEARARIERRIVAYQDHCAPTVNVLADFVESTEGLPNDEILMAWDYAKSEFEWSRSQELVM